MCTTNCVLGCAHWTCSAPALILYCLRRWTPCAGGDWVKDTSSVTFEEDMILWISAAEPVRAHLTGILVHTGRTLHTGHYFYIARGPGGEWCQYSDSNVTPRTWEWVKHQEAYLLVVQCLPLSPDALAEQERLAEARPRPLFPPTAPPGPRPAPAATTRSPSNHSHTPARRRHGPAFHPHGFSSADATHTP